MSNIKIGLVLEGGGMRGMYTAGILDVLLENKIRFDCITGVSAGALFGVNYLSKQKGRVIRYNKKYNSDKNYMGIRPLIKEGNIVSTKYAYGDVPLRLDPFDNEVFKKSDTPFYAVITNVKTGKAEYVHIKSVIEQMDTLRASASMPFVSKSVQINNNAYLDGGITDSIPYEFTLSLGCDKVVVILTRDMEYRKNPMSKFLVRMRYGKSPIAEKLLQRHNVYNSSVEKLKNLEKTGQAIVIRPSVPIEISRTEKNPEKLQQVYELGIKEGKDFLNSQKGQLLLNMTK